jgi:hypothetical protein
MFVPGHSLGGLSSLLVGDQLLGSGSGDPVRVALPGAWQGPLESPLA